MQKHSLGLIEYYTHGQNPGVLFLSGMHGDEYESGRLLEAWLLSTYSSLPPFLYIPRVSPSAVQAGTRRNAEHHDINRKFLDHTDDREVRDVMGILSGHTFTVCLDIHEDPDRTQAFYIYDSSQMTDLEREAYRNTVHKTPFKLYTGIDDIDDEHLQRHIEKGYVSLQPTDTELSAGFASVWLMKQMISKRAFTIEIPGKARPQDKQILLQNVLPFLLGTFGVQ